MAHCIELPHDKVLSVEGTEWHGLAEQHEEITSTEVAPLFYEVKESPALVQIDGNQISLDNYKVLVADYRTCRTDLDEAEQLVPLHIPKAGYNVIQNSEVWDCMETALKGVGAKVTTAGTLEKGKKFFISADIGDKEQTINGDKFCSYVNFITSHDGTIAMNAYDSTIRIVCMNTLRWSMEAAGKVGFKVYHTKNANLGMNNLGDLLNAILNGRTMLKEVMEFMGKVTITNEEAIAMAAGYFCISTGKEEIATRSYNAATEIATLFSRGQGNRGESLYDLVNGATEYWTSGNGVGKTGATLGSRIYRSSMGAAADHKNAFVGMMADEESRKDAYKMGKAALDAYALAN